MAAATAQGTYINPMAALAHVGAGQLPHALNGMPNPVVPPTSGTSFISPLNNQPRYFLSIFFWPTKSRTNNKTEEFFRTNISWQRSKKGRRTGNYEYYSGSWTKENTLTARILKEKKKGRGGWISEKLFEINGTREENIQSPPPYVHFVVKFPSFTGAKLLSLSTLLLPLFPASPIYSFSRGSRGCESAAQSVAL